VNRFHAATRVGASAGARSFFSDETRLLLYALEKQATKGAREKVSEANEDINEFDGDVSEDVRRAMDETWKQLGTMSREEAMRLYVKVMDEEKPRWYESVDGECVGRTNKGMHGKTGERALPRALRALSEGKWEFCEYRGKKPLPRFQHAACALKSKMYVIGGSFRGRFMEDTHELDLDARDGGMEWRALKTKLGSEALPACAGHRAIAADGSVFVVGGRFKNAESMYMSVYKVKLNDIFVYETDTDSLIR